MVSKEAKFIYPFEFKSPLKLVVFAYFQWGVHTTLTMNFFRRICFTYLLRLHPWPWRAGRSSSRPFRRCRGRAPSCRRTRIGDSLRSRSDALGTSSGWEPLKIVQNLGTLWKKLILTNPVELNNAKLWNNAALWNTSLMGIRKVRVNLCPLAISPDYLEI